MTHTVFRPYPLVVFDLDGTLYRQGPVRRAMARALVADALARRSTRVIRLLRTYRKDRAGAVGPFDEGAVRAKAARTAGLPVDEADRLITHFMHERPLALLARARVAGAEAFFAALRASGTQVAVWSDFPIGGKLEALALAADVTASAEDADVRAQKPDPQGLLRLMERTGVAAHDTLLIGDRRDRDGEAARRAGTAFLLRSARAAAGIPTVADFTDPRLDALVVAPG